MQLFRKINYRLMLYEALRNYFSVNSSNEISMLYKYCSAFLQPLQAPFDAYDLQRKKNDLIASCKWQIGQLTNVLNFLYDTLLARIFITQSVVTVISDPTFDYPAIHFDGTFEEAPLIFEREFFDRVSISAVIINVPTGVTLSDITATIEQIRLQGIPYTIVFF